METVVDNYQIPLAIAKKENVWYVGNEAKRQKAISLPWAACFSFM